MPPIRYTPRKTPSSQPPAKQPKWLTDFANTLKSAFQSIGAGVNMSGSTVPHPSPVQYQQAARRTNLVRYRGPRATSTGNDLQAYAAQQRAQMVNAMATQEPGFTALPEQNLNDLQRYAAYRRQELMAGMNAVGGQRKGMAKQQPLVKYGVPGRNTALEMPEKVYRKVKIIPPVYGREAYPQGYAEQPLAGAAAPAGGYPYDYGGGYGGGGGYTYTQEPGYTGPNAYQAYKGRRPYMNDVPRWLQGLVTWRFGS